MRQMFHTQSSSLPQSMLLSSVNLPNRFSYASPFWFSSRPRPSLPSSPSAVACTLVQDRPCAQSVRSSRTNEFIVSEPHSDRSIGKSINPIHRVNLAIAFVQAEREFIHIALHVFDAEMVERAVVATLQDRPYALDPVRVCHTVHIHFGAVIDRMMIVS